MGADNLLKRFDPNRVDELLNTCGWSDEEEISALVAIARATEIKALPSALAAIKMLRDRAIESLTFGGLISKIQGHIQGRTDEGRTAQITTTSYKLGSHTAEMLQLAYGTQNPALPFIEGEVVHEPGDQTGEPTVHASGVGGRSVHDKTQDGGCEGEPAPQDPGPPVVERPHRRNQARATRTKGDKSAPQEK